MKHGSLFAGIGGFDLGFDRAGIETAWQVEIDDKCNQVLDHHWPNVKRHEDVNDVGKRNLESVDIITGGFPCQDLSVAGRREGLAGKRSGLWFQFHRILAELRPRWCVIENVPGLLSSNGGRDFAIILQGLAEIGYLSAWRVLDAQYHGVAQRRRRVFIVGSLGDGSCAEILFESESLSWDTAPSREARKGITAPLKASSPAHRGGGSWPVAEEFIVWDNGQGDPNAERSPVAYSINPQMNQGIVQHALSGHNQRNDPDSKTFIIAQGLSENQRGELRLTPYSRQITTGGGKPGQGYPAVLAFQSKASSSNSMNPSEVVPSLSVGKAAGSAVHGAFGVRRLTPMECERLQGFPPNWTAINGMSDSARYRMLGNAVAVPKAKWIGQQLLRIA